MNEATYHGKDLLLGPQNFFKLGCSTRPSFGFFRAPKSLVDYVLDTQSGAAGDLVLTSDPNKIVTLTDIYLVRATSLPTLEDEVFDIVLADERILWQYKYGTQDYNTYQKDRTMGSGDFGLKNLKTPAGGEDRPWTFEEVVAEIKTVLGADELKLDDDNYPEPLDPEDPPIPERAPRNIIGKNVTGACMLQQLLLELGAFVCQSYSGGDVNYTIYPLGAKEEDDSPDPLYDGNAYDDTTTLVASSDRVHTQRTTRINPLVQKGGTVKMLSSSDDDENEARLLTYGSKTIASGSGSKLLPTSFAVFGVEENALVLADIGNEVAQEYVDSFQNTWRDSIYAGIVDFSLNRAVHEIVWSVTAQGAFTHIRSFRPREDTETIRDELFSYHRYLVGAGGGASASWAQVLRGLQYEDPTGVPEEGYGTYLVKLLTSGMQAWQSGVEYVEDTLVAYEGFVYNCLVDHTSVPETDVPPNCPSGDLTDNTYWECVSEIEVTGIAMEGTYTTTDLRDWGRWFVVDDIVPVVKRSGEWYIWQTLIPMRRKSDTGEKRGSLSWNADDKRMMAVFR